jgi:SUN domain-containing protein 1/2
MDELEKALQSGRASLLLHNDKTSHLETVLQSSLKLADDSTSLSTTIGRSDELIKKVENTVRQLNMRQLLNLSKNLTELLNAETTRRRTDNAVAGMVDSISMDFLDDVFDAETVLAASESQLDEWVGKLMNDEISNLSKLEVAVVSGNSCVSVEQGAREVQQAIVDFMHDKIGLKDHAQGSTIVYEMTSSSYEPPAAENELLGSWKWRRLIPEDWEPLLPRGWQSWKVRLPSSVLDLFGQSAATSVASPQTIFHPDTRPGSCWPLSGRQGFVTFRLPYPVRVSAVSIDHVSSLLLSTEQDMNSAPKDVSVYGFLPCDEHKCEGLGFDSQNPLLLKQLSFDIKGPSTQTFTVLDSIEKQKDVTEEAEILESGSCLATSSTCGSSQVVSAIQMRVENNWGNAAYTCIYRFRVHAEAA